MRAMRKTKVRRTESVSAASWTDSCGEEGGEGGEKGGRRGEGGGGERGEEEG